MCEVTVTHNKDYLQVILPKSCVEQLKLNLESRLFISTEGDKIILSKEPQITLEELFKGSAKADFELTDEDRVWLG